MKERRVNAVKCSLAWVGIGRSETGHVRPTNQDAFAVMNDRSFWIVADGMGGHPAGDLAARIAVDTVVRQAVQRLLPAGPSPEDPALALSDWLVAANRAVCEAGSSKPSLGGMGTTAVALAITLSPEPVAHVAHLGDSRAYLFRDGTLTQLTQDHTLVAEYLLSGSIDSREAASHPKRHLLIKALGIDPGMKPDRRSIPLVYDDLLMLCSDGLTKMLADDDIAAILSVAPRDPSWSCTELIERALSRGGEDNVTVIVCAHAPAQESRL